MEQCPFIVESEKRRLKMFANSTANIISGSGDTRDFRDDRLAQIQLRLTEREALSCMLLFKVMSVTAPSNFG
ncbi:MAG: hypothetical protein COA78_14085 [Blastopirellula sp.]|nr:MAG: hypothetical protein COA78_14085 [Blastopirellula sp.]